MWHAEFFYNPVKDADAEAADRESQRSFGQLGLDVPATPCQKLRDSEDGGSAPKTPGKPKVEKAEKRKCGLCKTLQPVADWPINCTRCRSCKRAIDNLDYCAKVQKTERWWKEVRKDEPKLREVVKTYLEQCPDNNGGGGQKKRGLFNTVRYQETFTASSGVINDDECIMMHRSRYLMWAQTHDNPEGAFTKAQAEAKWTEMQEAAELGNWLHSRQGPQSEPLLLLIKVSNRVIFRNEFAHAKVQEAQQNRELHKVGAEAVEAGRRSLLRDHERGLGRDGQHDDFGSIAQCMITSASAANPGGMNRDSAFSGSGVYMPNLEMMQEELAEAETQKKEEAEAKKTKRSIQGQPVEGNPQADATAAAIKPAEKVWFDEGAINRAKRGQEAAQAKLQESLEKHFQSAVSAYEKVPDRTAAVRERETLSTRLRFLVAVMGYNPDIVSALVDAPTAQTAATLMQKKLDLEEQKSTLSKLQTAAQGGRAPCIGFEDLWPERHIDNELKAKFELLLASATSKDEILAVSRQLDSQRQPILKLCKAVASAAKDLISIVNSKKRLAAQVQAQVHSGDTQAQKRAKFLTPPPSAAKRAPIFELATIRGGQIAAVSISAGELEASFDTMNLGQPLLLTGSQWPELTKDNAMQAAISQFKAAWMTSPMRVTTGRASQKLVAPLADAVQQAAVTVLKPALCLLPSDANCDDLKTSLGPTIFAASGGCEHAYVEKDACAAARLTLQGTREVVLIPPELLASCLSVSNVTLSQLCNGLLSAPGATFEEHISKFVFATVGVNDMLYTPPGWITAERVHRAPNRNGDDTQLQSTTWLLWLRLKF